MLISETTFYSNHWIPYQARVQGKKKGHQSKFLAIWPIFCYFFSQKYNFLCYFLSWAPPPWKIKKQKKKSFRLWVLPLRIPGHVPAYGYHNGNVLSHTPSHGMKHGYLLCISRGQTSQWPKASQKAAAPAKAILWLALLASHNFVQVLSVILYSYLSISSEIFVRWQLWLLRNLTTNWSRKMHSCNVHTCIHPQVRNVASLVHKSGFSWVWSWNLDYTACKEKWCSKFYDGSILLVF